MSFNTEAFTKRLVEIGVTSSGVGKELTSIMKKSYKDPRFPEIVNHYLTQVESWHKIASEVGYTSDPEFSKTVDTGLKLVLKFAKSNVGQKNISSGASLELSKKLGALNQKINETKQKIELNTEGVTRMDIKQTSLDMMVVYKEGLNQIKSSVADDFSLGLINDSYKKLEQIEALINSAVDTYSREAAKLQTDIFTAINTWEADYAYGNFNRVADSKLNNAIKAATAWSLIPLNLKAKPAKENEYVPESNIGTRMRNYATTYDAIAKIEQAIGLVGRARNMHKNITDTTRIEEQKAENLAKLQALEQKREQLNYLVSTGQMSLKQVFLETKNNIDPQIERLEKLIKSENSEIALKKKRLDGLNKQTSQIENVCRNFISYKDDPNIINLFAQHVNFQALTNFLTGSKLDSNINDIVNLAELERITGKRFDEAISVLDERLESLMQEDEELLDYNNQEQEEELSEEEMLAYMNKNKSAGFGSFTIPNDPIINTENINRMSLSEDDN